MSPTGNDFVFELVYERNSFLSTIAYRNAVVGTGKAFEEAPFLEVFQSSRSDNRSRVNAPAFSPDGQMLLVTDNYSAGALSTFYTDHLSSDIVTSIDVLPVP